MSSASDLSPDGSDIHPITIEEEMKASYLDYAMSVIVSRALPDVRDGLKPVHRRILFSCHENGYEWNKPYRKSARIVGDVMGKYHPHGDSAIYDALVRLAQDFSMRVPLIDGQGNFGSMDGDGAAAMRYTEARMAKVATMLLEDIEKETVAFQPNYDESESEPMVLPARFPNLLVNGAAGIAVGMATNVPPHNLGEVIDAVCAVIDNPEIDLDGLMEHIKGPDFPTGATILGAGGIRQAFETGRGSIILRSKTRIEEIRKDRDAIIIDEVPYQVNKASMIEKIAECVQSKRIEGIADIRDESDRDGVRVVIELKRDAVADVVLNQLYRFTPVQTHFGINMLALNAGRPEQLPLKDILKAFISFREEVITKRTKFDLNKARDRAHIMVGLVTAVAHIDEVVAMIRQANSPAAAREALLAKAWPAGEILPYLQLIDDGGATVEAGTYQLSETQVKAILDLRLHRLTALGREEIGEELEALAEKIRGYLEILGSRARLYEVLRLELEAVREEFATDRKTEIDLTGGGAFDDEDLIAVEDMVVTATRSGYIKRVPLAAYRAQKRGGKGRSGMTTKDEDFLTNLFVATTHTPVLFFTTMGQVYKMKLWRLPLATPQGKGKAFVNILPHLRPGEGIATILPLPEDEDSWGDLNVMFATAYGNVRRNNLSDFSNVMSNGKIAIKFSDENDSLIGVQVCTADDDILLSARGGRSVRFKASDVRLFVGRSSTGVRGMRLQDGDEVVSLSVLNGLNATTEERDAYLKSAAWKAEPAPIEDAVRHQVLADSEQFLLTVTANGFGKCASSLEYRQTNRGGQGIWNGPSEGRLRDEVGDVVAVFPLEESAELMLVTDQGKLIRTATSDIRVTSRTSKGVRIFRVADNESVVSVASFAETESDEDDGDVGDGHDTTDTESAAPEDENS